MLPYSNDNIENESDLRKIHAKRLIGCVDQSRSQCVQLSLGNNLLIGFLNKENSQ